MPTLEELRAQLAEAEAVEAAKEEAKRKPWQADLADLDDHRVSGPQLARVFRAVGDWLDTMAEKLGVESPLLAERTATETALAQLVERIDAHDQALADAKATADAHDQALTEVKAATAALTEAKKGKANA